ncbi:MULTISPECIES: hypothetical protein [unclassified Streptomyces]|uniref:hypothetical protein n=1 Tax=unclassified Streptomyces TaxID=2593676 RepID=UPI00095C052A|nr:hypothetical protein [Streptomyces sp. TSRI0281]OKI45794.1 hypothetical protein A6A29_29855 [Streptomyces sp. TSRI0281]
MRTGRRPRRPGSRTGPDRTCVELVGDALGGRLVDVTSRPREERAAGPVPITNDNRYGPGCHADYEPRADDPSLWDWSGDAP